MKNTKKKKRNFSSFTLAEAFKELGLINLTPWKIPAKPVKPSDFYQERVRRLAAHFDLSSSERAKELLIDAICDEVLVDHPLLKIWKAALVQSAELTGIVDYAAAPNRGYLDNPLLCVVEAKKDDFEQGLAQCLVEMKACQWSNAQRGNEIDIYGIVTNGEGWKFYQLTIAGEVLESSIFSLGELPQLLGCLQFVFAQCEKNITVFAKAA